MPWIDQLPRFELFYNLRQNPDYDNVRNVEKFEYYQCDDWLELVEKSLYRLQMIFSKQTVNKNTF